MSKNVKLDMKVDVNELIRQIGSLTDRTSINDQYLDNNQCRWISGQSNGILYSMCYHQTKQHSATCEVHNNFRKMFGAKDEVVRRSKSEAPPGEWAIAYCNSGKFGGDRTSYDFW